MSKHPWYHTTRWRKKRKRQLAEHPLCTMCERRGIVTVATVADHVTPHNGDPDLFWYGELQSLCASCHSGAKAMQERHGYSQGCDVDGMPIDSNHPWRKGAK